MNYHLGKAGYPHQVKNFGSDVQDSSAYSALMHQLNPEVARFVTGQSTELSLYYYLYL